MVTTEQAYREFLDWKATTTSGGLTATGVLAGTYGDGTNVPQLTVNTFGQVTAVSDQPITISGGGMAASAANVATAQTSLDIYGSTVPSFALRHSLGTRASPTAVTSGTELGAFVFGGQYDTTVGHILDDLGSYRAYADENFTSSAGGTHLELWATPTGSTTPQVVANVNTFGLSVSADTTTQTVAPAGQLGTDLLLTVGQHYNYSSGAAYTLSNTGFPRAHVELEGVATVLTDPTGTVGNAWGPAFQHTIEYTNDTSFAATKLQSGIGYVNAPLIVGRSQETSAPTINGGPGNSLAWTLGFEDDPVVEGGSGGTYTGANLAGFISQGFALSGSKVNNRYGFVFDDLGARFSSTDSTPILTDAAGAVTNVVTSFTGSQTFNVDDTTGFPSSGTVTVVTSNGVAKISYTGKTSNTFTGCTTTAGSGDIADEAVVSSKGIVTTQVGLVIGAVQNDGTTILPLSGAVNNWGARIAGNISMYPNGATLTGAAGTQSVGSVFGVPGTFTATANASAFGMFSGYTVNATLTNSASVAANLGPGYLFVATSNFQADTQSITSPANIDVYSQPTYQTVNAGTLTATSHTSLKSTMAVSSGATLTDRYALYFQEATGAGTLTNQTAIYIEGLSHATTGNTGIHIASATGMVGINNQASLVQVGNASFWGTTSFVNGGNVSFTAAGTIDFTGATVTGLSISNLNPPLTLTSTTGTAVLNLDTDTGAAVANNTALGQLAYGGAGDASHHILSAKAGLTASSDELWVYNTNAGSRLSVQTTPNGSVTPRTVAGWDNAGIYYIGTNATRVYTIDQTGAVSQPNYGTTATIDRFQHARGTLGSPTQLLAGDIVKRFLWQGYNNTDAAFDNAAYMDVVAAEAFTGAGHSGASIQFAVNDISATGATVRTVLGYKGTLWHGGITQSAGLVTAANAAIDNNGKVWVGGLTISSGAPTAATITLDPSNGILAGNAFSAIGLTGATAGGRWVGTTVSGAPVSGTFLLGDWVNTQNGHVFICTTAGTPGTWTDAGGTGTTYSAGTGLTLTGTTFSLTNPVTVSLGGTGLATLTAHALQVGNGTSTVTQLAVGTNGQLLVGQTSADPAWHAMSGDATIGATGVVAVGAVGSGGASSLSVPLFNTGGTYTADPWSSGPGLLYSSATYTLNFASATLSPWIVYEPTVAVKQSAGTNLQRVFSSVATFKNDSSGAFNIGSGTNASVTVFNAGNTYEADGQTITGGAAQDFRSAPTITEINVGSLTVGDFEAFRSVMTVNYNSTVTTRYGLRYVDATLGSQTEPPYTRTLTGGSWTNGIAVLNSSTNNFTANDVGATVQAGSGIQANTTITSFTSTSQVVISPAPNASNTGTPTLTQNTATTGYTGTTRTGAVTTQYGIFVPTLANATTNWAASLAGTTINGAGDLAIAGNVGFYGTSPVGQFTAAGNTAISAAGSTNTVFRNTTFTGGTGSTAYTIGDLVRALKLAGFIAS